MLFPYTLGIVAIMKNEAPYVKEWLDYHLNAGVDIVYLYDNDSTDNLKEIVSPYIESGRVVYSEFPGKVPQLRCYHDALKKYRYSCKYLAFIDADEFIYPTDNGSIKDFVENYFENISGAGYLHLYWRIFGSSGEQKADLSKGVLERFKMRAKNSDSYGKSIVNPRLVVDYINTPHAPFVLDEALALNEDYKNIMTTNNYPAEKIFIAHFAAKSKEEWIFRHKERGDGFFKNSPQLNADGSLNEDKFEEVDKNEVKDDRVYKYYLKNLNSGYNNSIAFSDCVKNAFEVLNANNLNMEEYFSAAHILAKGKYFETEKSANSLRELLKSAFLKALDNMSIFYAELFFEELPFIVKYGIMERDTLKQIVEAYFESLETYMLENKNYIYPVRIRLNKIWLDVVV